MLLAAVALRLSQPLSAFVKQIEVLRLFYGCRQPTRAEDLYNGSTVFAARDQLDQSWRMGGYDRYATWIGCPKTCLKETYFLYAPLVGEACIRATQLFYRSCALSMRIAPDVILLAKVASVDAARPWRIYGSNTAVS